jgi:hypothetical protein
MPHTLLTTVTMFQYPSQDSCMPIFKKMHLDIQYTVKRTSDGHISHLTQFYSFQITTIHHSFPRTYQIQLFLLRWHTKKNNQKPRPYTHSFPQNIHQDSGHKILSLDNNSHVDAAGTYHSRRVWIKSRIIPRHPDPDPPAVTSFSSVTEAKWYYGTCDDLNTMFP